VKTGSDLGRVLIVDKPAGMTSHDVVDRIRRATRVRKVGHSGTLDPGATGVLVVMVGKATRLAQFLVDLEKEYRGHMTLGIATDTQDGEGRVIAEREAGGVTRADVEEAFGRFEGEIQQVPPMVSALKRDGTPLYVLARRGIVVDREARQVTVRRLRLLEFASPSVGFEAICSRGTYVRTLAADVGEALGCGAHLADLRRTRVGGFGIDRALKLDEIARVRADVESIGLSMFEALAPFPALEVSEWEESALSNGGAIEVSRERLAADASYVRLTTNGSDLVAIGRLSRAVPESDAAEGDGPESRAGEGSAPDGSGIVVKPVRVFVDPI